MTGDGDVAPSIEGIDPRSTTGYIATVQRPDGRIPWYEGGPVDPWNHVESAMGLSVGGANEAAERAYSWLDRRQLDDGSWWALYNGGDPAPESGRETHRAAYVAVGVWHHYRVSGDRGFVERLWPTVKDALSFAVDYQSPDGEVYWAVDADGTPYEDALLSGCCSIFKSLECGIAIARLLGEPHEEWLEARERLGEAIRRGDRFDRTWADKDRFAMHWFYPVLCGAVEGGRAVDRLGSERARFVEDGTGCRCVADEPWVTVAESSELVLALAGAGRRREAADLFDPLSRFRDDDGAYWIGYQLDDDVIWPEQKPTWTAGAVLLAADALCGLTPASGFFGGDTTGSRASD